MAIEYPLAFNRKLRWSSFRVLFSSQPCEFTRIFSCWDPRNSPFWDRKSRHLLRTSWLPRQSNVAKKNGGPGRFYLAFFLWPRIQRVKKMMDSRCCCLVSFKSRQFQNHGSVKEIDVQTVTRNLKKNGRMKFKHLIHTLLEWSCWEGQVLISDIPFQSEFVGNLWTVSQSSKTHHNIIDHSSHGSTMALKKTP